MSFMQSLGFKTSQLSAAERSDLARLEGTVHTHLAKTMAVGQALAEIRERQLYRAEFESFEAYCEARFKLTARRAYQLITAAGVAENVNQGTHPLNERAARELGKLPAEEQNDAWQEATAEVPQGETVPLKVIAETVARRQPGKARKGRPKPVRIRVPGGTVIVEMNKRGTDIYQALADAMQKVQSKAA